MVTRSVRKIPKNTGPAGWNAVLPPARPSPSLAGSIAADWLVIGAGFAGLSAARRLTQLFPSDSIVVIEATGVAQGSAGRNSGFMIDLPHNLSVEGYAGDSPAGDRKQTEMNRAAIAFAAEAAQEYGFSPDVFDICGKINAAATEKGLIKNREFARHLRAMGEPHEILDARAMAERCGTPYYKSGVFSPGTAMLQPAAYIRGLAHGLRNRIDLHENTPAVRFTRHAGDWVVETPAGKVTAHRVILAVNGHAESFGFFERRLMHVFAYASMSRALTANEIAQLGGAARWGVLPSDPMGTTVRRISGQGGDRIVVRNHYTYDPSMVVSETRIQNAGIRHDRIFADRFPMLPEVTMEYRWAGRLCLSWNGVPAFGELEPGLFSACCCNGLGLARGTFLGIMAAELAAGRAPPLLADILKMDRPSLLPPEPLTWLGVNATLRWGEWRAGAE
ncbi:MAG: NAD(P)/FAD-dependent oxidoreductase [Parvibaculaceae bacterium]